MHQPDSDQLITKLRLVFGMEWPLKLNRTQVDILGALISFADVGTNIRKSLVEIASLIEKHGSIELWNEE